MKKSSSTPYDVFLIEGLKEWTCVIGFFLLIFSFGLGWKYYEYLKLDFSNPQEIYAQILLQYPKTKEKTLKNGLKKLENYFVLKMSASSGNVIYTISKEDIKDLQNRYVRVYGKMKECSFVEFLKSCYFNTYYLSLLHKRDYRDKIREFIDTQHQGNSMGNLYRALFIADPLIKEWREVSNKLGLAHIIAISGFHLGILSGFFYLLLSPFYRFVQRRYFPYRNEAYDLGGVILCLMFGYLILLGYQPSFLRSFVMALMGFLLYYSGVRLLSFSSLAFALLVCIGIFPTLLLNIGFILSVSGVFYIFLFIKHFPKMHFIPYTLFFNLAIFFQITPVVNYFFPYFSPYQFVSIPVSVVFIIFFPLSLGLHFLGTGGLLDRFLLPVLSLNVPFIEYYTPFWFLIVYVGISLGAIYSRILYLSLNIFAMGFFIFLLLKYL